MIEINLLPHREARRAADLRQTVGVLVLGLILETAVIWYMNSGIQDDLQQAQTAVRQLESDIEQYKPQEAKVAEFKKVRSHLEDKLAVIDGLDRGRTGPVRLMDEIADHTPDRLWLTKLETKGLRITVEGESLDTGMVADFLRGLNESAYFRNVDLDRTSRGKEIEGVKLVTFVITAELQQPVEPKAEEAAQGA
jgi:type IV pilus assembly protein PilN